MFVAGPVPQVGVAGAVARKVATFVVAVGVGVGVHRCAAQVEFVLNVLVVGQAHDLADVGESGEVREIRLALPTLVVLHGLGVAGDEGCHGLDEGGDAAAQTAEGGGAWFDGMASFDPPEADLRQLRMSGWFGGGIATPVSSAGSQ